MHDHQHAIMHVVLCLCRATRTACNALLTLLRMHALRRVTAYLLPELQSRLIEAILVRVILAGSLPVAVRISVRSVFYSA